MNTPPTEMLRQWRKILATNSHDLNLPDDAERTPLHLAATHCHTNVVVLLLDKGAKIDPRAEGGATPLHLAAQEGCVDVVNLLLAKGAKVNQSPPKGRGFGLRPP